MGIHATSVELCLDAELGKKSYVAELRAYGDDLSIKIDGKSYKGLVKVSLFKFDDNNKRVCVGDLFTTVNANMMYEDGFKYLREGYLQELDAVFSITAGDLDRDFKDDLAITVSASYAKSNISEATYCELYTWNDGTSSLTHVNGIGDNGRIALSSGSNTMIAANVTFGTFAKRDKEGAATSDTVTGLIVAGYDWDDTVYNLTCHKPNDLAYRYVYYDVDDAEFKTSGYQSLPPTDGVSDCFGLGKPGVERVYSGPEFNGVGSSQGASVSQEIEVDESHTHSYETGLSINGEFLGGASFRKQEFLGGFVLNFSAGYSHGWISSKGQSFGGTVDNLPEEAKGDYGFQWRVGVNMVDRDKFEKGSDGKQLGSKDTDKFWIIGYDVRDAQQPMAPAERWSS